MKYKNKWPTNKVDKSDNISNIQKDILIYLLNKQLSLHQLSDTKVYFIFGILGFIAWKIIPVLADISKNIIDEKHLVISVLLIISMILLVGSYIYALIKAFDSIFPKVPSNCSGKENDNVMYFTCASLKEKSEVSEQLLSKEEDYLLKMLSNDYHNNANITVQKFKSAKQAFFSAFISLFAFIILYFLSSLLSLQSPKNKTDNPIQNTACSASTVFNNLHHNKFHNSFQIS